MFFPHCPSRLWWYAGSGQSGWDPAAATALPSRWSPISLPLLFGNRPFTAWAIGASAVVPERQGGTAGSSKQMKGPSVLFLIKETFPILLLLLPASKEYARPPK